MLKIDPIAFTGLGRSATDLNVLPTGGFVSPGAVPTGIDYTFTPTLSPTNTGIVPPKGITASITIKTLVVDPAGKPLPGALLIRNGEKAGAAADANGVVALKAEPTDNLYVSYQGYGTQKFTGLTMPARVTLKEAPVDMNAAMIKPGKKESGTNWLLWGSLAALAAAGAYKYSQSKKQPVKAKI